MDVKQNHLSRAELERGGVEQVRRGGWKAGLWFATDGDRLLMVKDVRDSNPVFRWLLGRWLLWHEANMYGYASGCDFVPRFVGWIDNDAWAIERVQATNLGKCRPPMLSPALYDRLEACVKRLHAVGVVHLDLRSRRNILVEPCGRPMLVDFGSALYIGRTWLSRHLLVPSLAWIDHSAIVKFRYRDFPETLTRRQRVRYRVDQFWHVLWPWSRLWRALGVNRGLKHAAGAAAPRAVATDLAAQDQVVRARDAGA